MVRAEPAAVALDERVIAVADDIVVSAERNIKTVIIEVDKIRAVHYPGNSTSPPRLMCSFNSAWALPCGEQSNMPAILVVARKRDVFMLGSVGL